MTEKQLQQKIKEMIIVLSEKRSTIIKNFRKKLEEKTLEHIKKNINNLNQ